MPNHVTNILHAAPEVLDSIMRFHTEKEIADSVTSEEDRRQRFIERDGNDDSFTLDVLDDKKRIIDFGLLIPIPDDDDPRCTATKHDYGGGMVGWSFDGLSPMDFARDLWGTKWNAYSQVVDDREDRIQFETAWSHPVPVIEALSKLHPDEEIRVAYADEDFGSNLGGYIIKNGVIIEQIVSDASPEDEKLEFAAKVIYDKPYAEVKAEWDADEIESAQGAIFCKQIETERGIENGYKIIREEGLEVPQEIKDLVITVDDAHAYWNGDLVLPKWEPKPKELTA